MTCTTGGRAEAVRVVMRDGGGAAVAPGNGLSPVPYNRVMVQGLVVRFIVSGLDEVGGGGGVATGGAGEAVGQVVASPWGHVRPIAC
jgi:hypothetical protein